MRDLMVLRITLEREAVARAATLSPDLTPVQALLTAMSSPDVTKAEFAALDCEFHIGVARAGGSELAAGVLADAKAEVLASLAESPDWLATTQRLVAEHTRILAAITLHDPKWAAAEVDAHITAFHRVHRDGALGPQGMLSIHQA